MSRKYELLYALSTAISDDAIETLNQKIQDLISSQAKIDKVDVWGRRRLA